MEATPAERAQQRQRPGRIPAPRSKEKCARRAGMGDRDPERPAGGSRRDEGIERRTPAMRERAARSLGCKVGQGGAIAACCGGRPGRSQIANVGKIMVSRVRAPARAEKAAHDLERRKRRQDRERSRRARVPEMTSRFRHHQRIARSLEREAEGRKAGRLRRCGAKGCRADPRRRQQRSGRRPRPAPGRHVGAQQKPPARDAPQRPPERGHLTAAYRPVSRRVEGEGAGNSRAVTRSSGSGSVTSATGPDGPSRPWSSSPRCPATRASAIVIAAGGQEEQASRPRRSRSGVARPPRPRRPRQERPGLPPHA